MEECKICKTKKELVHFTKMREKYTHECKECYNKRQREKYTSFGKEAKHKYYEKNKKEILNDRIEYAINNKEIIKTRNKKYYSANKQEIIKQKQRYYIENKEIILDKQKKHRKENIEKYIKRDSNYYIENRERCIERSIKYEKRKMKEDLIYRLKKIVKKELKRALNKNYKSGKDIILLGCSIEELKIHLEKQFYQNKETGEIMNWKNHSYCGWHIDHIIPLASAKSEDEVKKLCHYTNLQPLWAKDNLQKSNKLNWSKK